MLQPFLYFAPDGPNYNLLEDKDVMASPQKLSDEAVLQYFMSLLTGLNQRQANSLYFNGKPKSASSATTFAGFLCRHTFTSGESFLLNWLEDERIMGFLALIHLLQRDKTLRDKYADTYSAHFHGVKQSLLSKKIAERVSLYDAFFFNKKEGVFDQLCNMTKGRSRAQKIRQRLDEKVKAYSRYFDYFSNPIGQRSYQYFEANKPEKFRAWCRDAEPNQIAFVQCKEGHWKGCLKKPPYDLVVCNEISKLKLSEVSNGAFILSRDALLNTGLKLYKRDIASPDGISKITDLSAYPNLKRILQRLNGIAPTTLSIDVLNGIEESLAAVHGSMPDKKFDKIHIPKTSPLGKMLAERDDSALLNVLKTRPIFPTQKAKHIDVVLRGVRQHMRRAISEVDDVVYQTLHHFQAFSKEAKSNNTKVDIDSTMSTLYDIFWGGNVSSASMLDLSQPYDMFYQYFLRLFYVIYEQTFDPHFMASFLTTYPTLKDLSSPKVYVRKALQLQTEGLAPFREGLNAQFKTWGIQHAALEKKAHYFAEHFQISFYQHRAKIKPDQIKQHFGQRCENKNDYAANQPETLPLLLPDKKRLLHTALHHTINMHWEAEALKACPRKQPPLRVNARKQAKVKEPSLFEAFFALLWSFLSCGGCREKVSRTPSKNDFFSPYGKESSKRNAAHSPSPTTK